MTNCEFTKDKIEGYHFTECGLDYVYLLNGYEIDNDPTYGELFSLHNSDALHREIARNIVLHRQQLQWQEIRFLRKELSLTQSEMSEYLSKSLRQYQRYERKDEEKAPKEIQDLIRILYWDYNMKTPSIMQFLNAVHQERKEKQKLHIQLLNDKDGWKVAA